MYTVHLNKEPFKFSCSHFTILTAKHAERLHGHNYQLRVSLSLVKLDAKLGLAFDFNRVKPVIRALCDELDERILLPARSEYLKIRKDGRQIEARFGKKTYSFPEEDTLALPLVNITSEELARFAGERLLSELADVPYWTRLRVNVEETRGQSVSYSLPRPQ